jgi:nicotinamidase-related amidase
MASRYAQVRLTCWDAAEWLRARQGPSFLEHSLKNENLRAWYRERGFGGRVGYGDRPAILAIDVGNLWLDPTHPEGSEQSETLVRVVSILGEARRADVPILFTTMGFAPDLSDCDAIYQKKLPHAKYEILGTPGTELHPDVERRPDEVLIEKKRQSAFFGTPLLTYLISGQRDTVIVVGFSTSGCIRSTCESAFNHGFHVVVPMEAVGDRSESAHEASLFDIDNRFADVVPAGDVLGYLQDIGAPSSTGRLTAPSADSDL